MRADFLILINIEQFCIVNRDTLCQCQGLNGICVRLPNARDWRDRRPTRADVPNIKSKNGGGAK
jgi:hypothetical protein